MPAPTSLTMIRHIKAPPQRVFAAFVEPDLIARWWGPDAGPVLRVETDPRPGGCFRMAFRTMDGVEHEMYGAYQEIEPPSRLVYTMRWAAFPERESLVTLTFAATATGTELTLLHERFSDAASRDLHAEGWAGTFAKLEAL